MKVDPALFARLVDGPVDQYHRSQIRMAYGTRPPAEDDERRWAQWLAEESARRSKRDRLAAALRRRCRSEKVEPPSRARSSEWSPRAAAGSMMPSPRRPPAARGRGVRPTGGPAVAAGVLAGLKSDPGPLGLDTLLAEIGKLSTVRALELDGAVFGGASDRIVAAWRARAAACTPRTFADCPEPAGGTRCWRRCATRQAERRGRWPGGAAGAESINARAERRVEKELTARWPPCGKRGIFTKTRPLLAAIEFKCNNTAYRPVMDALALLQRYADVPNSVRSATTPRTRSRSRAWCPRAGWKAIVEATGKNAAVQITDTTGRIERVSYELCVLVALKDALRRREIYVSGASRRRKIRRRTCRRISRTTATCTTATCAEPLDPHRFHRHKAQGPR